jgi:phosphate transport system substrate-binding protein
MKKALDPALALAADVAVALVGGRANAATDRQMSTLVGTGATFPFPLISKWIPEVGKAYGIDLTYSPTGSGAGIAGVTSRTVDFGASDAPLSADQLAACKGCVVIPWALAGVSLPYNLPGVNARLKLDSAAIVGIFDRSITRWNDPKIQKLNSGVSLPSTTITPVYRSDSSGTTYAFTDYLSTVSPKWKSSVGNNTSVSWPGGIGARGSSGVTGVVKSTPGAITYVDAAYSIQNHLSFALVRNRAGKYTTPGLRGITSAVSVLPKKITSFTQLKIVDPPKTAPKNAYPISTFTYVIVPIDSGSKAADLRKFVYWAVTQGQRFGPPLFFVPLPNQVKAYDYREIKKIQGGGQ